MRAVGRSDTAPERQLGAYLAMMGLRTRARGTRLPGTPDLVYRHARVAVFVDGCFWHGCPVHGSQPKHNGAFWAAKFARNRLRDRRVDRSLRAAGWLPIRVWEHQIVADTEAAALRIAAAVLRRHSRKAPPARSYGKAKTGKGSVRE